MAEKYTTAVKKPKSLTEIVNDYINQGKPVVSSGPTYGGDENVDWQAIGHAFQPSGTNLSATAASPSVSGSSTTTTTPYKPPIPLAPKTTGVAPAGTVYPAGYGFKGTNGSEGPDGPIFGGGGNNGTTPADSIPSTSGASNRSPVDRSNYQSYAQTIARLQNDPKVLALRQKLAQLRQSGTDEESALKEAYSGIPDIIMRNLIGQKRRITDTYNQRGLYGSGLEIGNLNQAEQAAQGAISSSQQQQADELTAIARRLGLLETQTNDQIAQVEGSSGDIIAQTLFQLNQQADQTDIDNQRWLDNYNLQREQMQSQLANQDWTRNFQERQYADDQGWKQKEYDLDLKSINQQIADAAAQSNVENMTPGAWAQYQVSQYDDLGEAMEDFAAGQMSSQMSDPANKLSPEYIWDLLRRRFNTLGVYTPEVANQVLQYTRYPGLKWPFRQE
jgi:hypothetical protein